MKALRARIVIGPVSVPTWAALALALFAAALAALNQTVFKFGSHWYAIVTAALIFLSGIGIGPAVYGSLRTVVHIPPAVSVVVSSAVAALGAGLTSVAMGQGAKAAVEFVLAFAAGVGYGPAIPLLPAPAPKAVRSQVR